MKLIKITCWALGHPYTERRHDGAWTWPRCKCGADEGAGWIGDECKDIEEEEE